MTDVQRPAHSIISAKERRARIKAEAEQRERELAEAEEKKKAYSEKMKKEALKAEDAAIEQMALVSSDETIEHLHQRIREMREEQPPPPAPVGYRTERQQEELNAEQAMGRAKVAQAEADEARLREFRAKVEEERIAREGEMKQVHHPNPSQSEQFPVQGMGPIQRQRDPRR